MTLTNLIAEIVADATADGIEFSDLPASRQRSLVAALIREDDSEVTEALLYMAGAQEAFARMVTGTADLFDFQHEFGNAAVGYYAQYLQDRIDDAFERRCELHGIYSQPGRHAPGELIGFAD